MPNTSWPRHKLCPDRSFDYQGKLCREHFCLRLSIDPERHYSVARLRSALRRAEQVSRLSWKYLKTLSAFSLVFRTSNNHFSKSRAKALPFFVAAGKF